jgi:histidinol dehydrogenase
MRVNFYDLSKMEKHDRERILKRSSVDISNLIAQVAPLIEDVRSKGDDAVRELTRRFDKADLEPSAFRVTDIEMEEALKTLPDELLEAMQASISNIHDFHQKQIQPHMWEMQVNPGITVGEKVAPLDSVGIYVPRGKGSFPSMMMMAGAPAKVAGVRRIVVTTPPDPSGNADEATLAAAKMIGIEEVYSIGGVQAVAAMALGTRTIPKVDKIVGPGSGHVLAAKRILSSVVDTGPPAGPSEAIILADNSVDALTAVTDLLIEAEHGPDSAAYLVTWISEFAEQALKLIPELVDKLPEQRASYCKEVFDANGGVILAKDQDDAIDFINDFAPEHLQALTSEPREILNKVNFAGEVLMGPHTPGTLANYSLGPNAILPTSGFARTQSALSVHDFTRRMSFCSVSEDAFYNIAPKTLTLAEYEGFAAHAAALKLRLSKRGAGN